MLGPTGEEGAHLTLKLDQGAQSTLIVDGTQMHSSKKILVEGYRSAENENEQKMSKDDLFQILYSTDYSKKPSYNRFQVKQ